jgi:opacity protein-like surface antigen
MSVSVVLGVLLALAPAVMAQEEGRNEISVQGTGFFTEDTVNNGIGQHSTDTGGFIVGYRYHFNRWIAAAADYGRVQNTQQNFTSAGPSNLRTNVHQATGALVVTLPIRRFDTYVLGGVGALVFDPTSDATSSVPGANRQAKAAFVYGGGANYWISHAVAIRAEYRGFVYKRPDFGLASLNSDAVAHTAQPSVGLVVRF